MDVKRGKLRVRVFCEHCGYVAINGTRVYVLKGLLDCPKCGTYNSMCAAVELPDGILAPQSDVELQIEIKRTVIDM